MTYAQRCIFPGSFTSCLPTIFGSLSRRIDRAIAYGGQDDSANTAPWVGSLCHGRMVGGIPVPQFAFLKSLFFTYCGSTVIETIEIFGEAHARVGIDSIIDHGDPFLADAAPNVNLIPAIVGAPPGHQDAPGIVFERSPR